MSNRKEMIKELKSIRYEYWHAEPQDKRYGGTVDFIENPKYIVFVLSSYGAGFLIAVDDKCWIARIVEAADINNAEKVDELYPELHSYVFNNDYDYEEYYEKTFDTDYNMLREFYYLDRVKNDKAQIGDIYIWLSEATTEDSFGWIYIMEQPYMNPGPGFVGPSWDDMETDELNIWHFIHQRIQEGKTGYWMLNQAEKDIANQIEEEYYLDLSGMR
jgi:hypothetical protein